MKLFLHWIWAPLILIIVVTIPFYETFTSQHPIGSNYPDTDLDYFLRMHHANFKANTVFPQWNPIDICGSPVRSEIQSGVFYPPNILFRWFPLFKTVSLYFWVHSLLLALFTYGLARNLFLSKPASIISALTLTFCGHCILGIYAGKLSNIATITWIPLQLSLISQLNQKHNTRIYLSMGIVFAIQFFAGHFQYMYYSFIFVCFYYQYVIIQYTGRLKYQLGIICAILIGGIICLPQILPVVDYVQETSRVNMTLSQSGQFSFPLENLLTILFPGIFGDMQHSVYWGAYNLWEMCAFCGIIPFLLCCMAIRNVSRRFVYFIVAGMISLIIALGANTPLFQLLYNFVPGISLFRGHSKAISIFCICIALLAGKGFDTIESTKTNNCKKNNGQLSSQVPVSCYLYVRRLYVTTFWIHG
ncbi:MAG: hypothetical protein OMM_01432 [Candidatus Magnetoglobus multicellularis str. Araruama]|uniref:Uncharacterized protein n=1 Tax=Candidatus Magnetoglobus multicellularis str. Araruama TaxID=890399 RepID=A0A1V1PDA7_9BACT|nr:MAG: hypothetical protein OMM_01432 [Candidatus Magnetoglobus multicellularis str. Araruama]